MVPSHSQVCGSISRPAALRFSISALYSSLIVLHCLTSFLIGVRRDHPPSLMVTGEQRVGATFDVGHLADLRRRIRGHSAARCEIPSDLAAFVLLDQPHIRLVHLQRCFLERHRRVDLLLGHAALPEDGDDAVRDLSQLRTAPTV
jgi:hypothetical protein